ncbi:MAG: CHAT domain-containing protein [Gammaproteobacteria bacterium]|nr:CHAT domain-containing protein [Gammaproteobacteria bacterium]MDH3766914.1 CHAT domain-containing protein [Gammaproteobacteria bacterium]
MSAARELSQLGSNSQSTLRRNVSTYFLVTSLLSLPPWAAIGADTSTQTKLDVGQTQASQLAADQSHLFIADLAPGQYLLTLTQDGLDLVLQIGPPASIAISSPTFRDDRETLFLDVSQTASYDIEISTDEYTGAIGQYSINIAKLNDDTTVSAHRLMTNAAAAAYLDEDKSWQKALDFYRSALDLWERTDNVAEQARSRYAIAQLTYWHAGNWTGAADEAAAAATLYERIGDTRLQNNALHLQAAALIEAASEAHAIDKDRAEDTYDQALNLFKAVLEAQTTAKQNYDLAQTLNNIGLTYFYRSDWTPASDYFSRAANEFRRLEEWSAELNPLANLAVIDQESGQLIRAVGTYQRLLELIPVDREAAWRADTLDNLAAAQLELGRPNDALKHFFSALNIHDERNNTGGQARSLAGLGSTYLSIGELDQARKYFKRALPLTKAANDGRSEAATLRSLATTERLLGDNEAASESYGKALEIDTTPAEQARVHIQRAGYRIDAGNYSQAETDLQQAQQTASATGVNRIGADAALQFGRLYAASGKSRLSEEWLIRARDVYSNIASQYGHAQSLLELARGARSTNIDQAIKLYRSAIDQVEASRTDVGEPELRAVFLGSRANYYEELIALQMNAYIAAPDDGSGQEYLRSAFEIAERARARATVDLINEAAVNFSSSVDESILSHKKNLNEKLAELQYQRDRALAAGKAIDDVQPIVADMQIVRTELDVLAADTRRTHPRYAEFNDPTILTVDQIQAQIDPDTVLLQYALGREASYVWAITDETLSGYEIASRSEIDALSRRIYNGLKSANRDAAKRRQMQRDLIALTQQIVTPALANVQGKTRMVIAADGALQYLPFAVLSMDGQSRLVDTYSIAVVPSITAVAAQRNYRNTATQPSKTIALIGDPVFSTSDRRFATSAATANHPTTSANEPDNNPTYTRLTFSGREIDEISALVPASKQMVATGFEASKDFAVNADLEDFRFIHFATHGVIDARQPALSTLVFSTRDRDGSVQNGFFRLPDVYNLALNAELVVLSACDTALGREIRGEGLLGLTQGFMYAGASSIVASLWQVPDRATAELMTRFYKSMLLDGKSAVAALRSAQLEMAHERRWANPFYWGGFVLQGEWR